MSQSQRHRGQQAEDSRLFDPVQWKLLNDAVDDQSWLLTRGYSEHAAASLVGDRYRLTSRQREAIRRAACSDEALFRRPANCLGVNELQGKSVVIDGYNLLITVESGLAGGFVVACRDGTFRDLASIHGTYRRVEETFPAIQVILDALVRLGVASVLWYLDKPVSNSGRLKGFLLEHAASASMSWEVELVNSPDKTLVGTSDAVVLSSDGWILDQAAQWANLARHLVESLPGALVLPLQGNRFAAGCGL